MNQPTPPPSEVIARGFLPLHKRALGMAFGAAAAVTTFLATAILILRDPPSPRFPLELLAQYFAGYSVTWTGALIGAAWAAFSGFVFGWFLAFCRNLTMALNLMLVRVRAELSQTRDFLDQI